MAITPNMFGTANDAQLQALIEQLSAGLTQQELDDQGLGTSGRPAEYNYAKSGSANLIGEFYDADFKGQDGGKSSKDRAYDRIALASPSAAIYHGLKNSKKKKEALKKKRAYDKAQTEAVENYKVQREAMLQSAKRELQSRQMKNEINSYYKSEKVEGLYDSLRSNVLQNSIADIINKYQDQLRDSTFQSAGQGLIGSSVEAERRGDIGQAQNTEAIQAAGNADRYVQGVRAQDDEQRRALVATLSSENPGDAASLEQQTRGVISNTQRLNDQYASEAARRQTEQYGMGLQSQAFGNLLSNYANLYQTGQTAQAYGGGSAF